MKNPTWKALGLIGIGFMVQNYISKRPDKEHPILKGFGEAMGKSLFGEPYKPPFAKVSYNSRYSNK